MLTTEQIANQIHNDPKAATEAAACLVALVECHEELRRANWWQPFKRIALYNRMQEEAGRVKRHLQRSIDEKKL